MSQRQKRKAQEAHLEDAEEQIKAAVDVLKQLKADLDAEFQRLAAAQA